MTTNFKTFLSRFLAIILLSIMGIAAYADRYTPHPDKVKSSLNIRSSQSSSASVLGQYKPGDEFDVVEINGQWAAVNYYGSRGYVNVDYIQLVTESTPVVAHSSSERSWKDVVFGAIKTNYDARWMVWLIMAFLGVMFIINKADMDPTPRAIWSAIFFILACLSELVYGVCMGSKFLWFCTEPRWWWCAINFIIFGFLAVMQISYLIGVAQGMSDDNAWLGIYSVPACLVGIIICAFVNASVIGWVLLAFAAAQVIQTIIIFRSLMEGGIGLAIFGSFTYLIGMAATLLVSAWFLVGVIIVLIGLLVLTILGSSSNRDLHLRSLGGGLYEDQHGNIWRDKNW